MNISMTDAVLDRFRAGLETAKRLGATAAKISLRHEEATSCGFEAGRLKSIDVSESIGYTITALVGRRMASTSGNRLDDLDTMIDRAVTLARVGGEAHFDAYPDPGEVTAVRAHSDRTLSLSREQMIDSCAGITGALKAYNPDLYTEASASRHESESVLVTSGGVTRTRERTSWSVGAFAQRTEGTDILMTGEGRGWCDLNELYRPAAVSEEILGRLRLSEKLVEPPQGEVKAYIPPDSVSMMLRPLIIGINGRNVFKGDSPLAGKLGQQILAPCITVVDDPHIEFSGGAAEVDSDGIPTERRVLVDKGVLQCFLYDLDTAGMADAKPTGNNGCSPWWTMLQPGDTPSSDLLAGIDDGVYIVDLIGFGQGNIANGDFSANVGLGFRIKDGEIVGRIKDTMVSGNLYELLKGDVRLSSDVGWNGRYPHMVFDGVSVSS